MMSFEFAKYQALGNDYLVIDPNKTKINLNTVKSGVINILKTTKKEINNDIKRK